MLTFERLSRRPTGTDIGLFLEMFDKRDIDNNIRTEHLSLPKDCDEQKILDFKKNVLDNPDLFKFDYRNPKKYIDFPTRERVKELVDTQTSQVDDLISSEDD